LNPFGGEQAIEGVVDEAIIEPLSLTNSTFELETQALSDGAASEIVSSAASFDAVQTKFVEAIVKYRPAALCDDTAPLKVSRNDVTEISDAIIRIDLLKADGAGEISVKPDAEFERVLLANWERLILSRARRSSTELSLSK
jgi:hypothetical protein